MLEILKDFDDFFVLCFSKIYVYLTNVSIDFWLVFETPIICKASNLLGKENLFIYSIKDMKTKKEIS